LTGFKSANTRFRPVLGIELNESVIRIVEIRQRNGEPFVAALATHTPSPGYLERGRVDQPEIIGQMLAKVLAELQITAIDVVVGVPASACLVRTLTLPPAPESELRTMIDGEVNHFQVLKQEESAYDYFQLYTENLKEAAGTSVFLAGVEMQALDSIKAMVGAAGLKLIAVEPVHLAMHRAAVLHNPAQPVSTYVTLSETHAEIAMLSDGQVAIYRSFDLGTNAIFSEGRSPDEPAEGEVVDPFRGPSRYEAESAPKIPGQLDAAAAGMLAVEIRRSIDYFAREIPDAPANERMVVASTHAGIEKFTDWLESVLQMEVEVASLSNTDSVFSEYGSTITLDDAFHFVAAYGLAVRNGVAIPKEIPRLDLAMQEQMLAHLEVSGRKFRMLATACAIAFVCAGGLLAFTTLTARDTRAQVERSKFQLKQLRDLQQARVKQEQDMIERLALLSKDGVPLIDVMGAIAQSVPSNAGLTEVRINPGVADVAGEAKADETIIRMSRNLQQSTMIKSVSLTWFERLEGELKGQGVRFRMSALTNNDQTPPPPPAQALATAAKPNGNFEGGMTY
jgi:type IV pilus assembly protein PilM